ncbi:MAG: FKBP-type peptidyl-prolyl cis-trans isomerase [Muribaculaceae bacterium]
MKKNLILTCAAALLFSAVSCNGGASSASSEKDLKTTGDSLSYYYAQMVGSYLSQGLKQNPDSTFKKDSFVKGIEAALKVDTTDVAYLQGLSMGNQMINEIMQVKTQTGVNLDTKMFINVLKETLKSDSTNNPQAAQEKFANLMQRLVVAKKANSPEAVANKKAGEAEIAKIMNTDKTIKKTASGLAYKVLSEGAGATFKDSDKISVKYTGKHIDGKVFDESGAEARSFSPNGVVPGFKEGLMMMKPGAKYVLYIPGNLAYGTEGQQMAGIAPNEMLIFEVETVGIAADAPATAPVKK